MHEQGWGGERGTERVSSRFSLSTEQDAALDLTTLRS